ncbi:MAG: tetratricopeptide repeat protein [Deltaproteobacteria bacterium]|nr:tetratricopeptide repeat protein [Deltaproteobacteria bacterium]
MSPRSLVALLLLLVTVLAAPAGAQPADPNDAPVLDGDGAPPAEDAGALFDRGLQAMLAGDYESGCPDLQKSYALEPLAGVMFTLAECYAKWGKLAAALEYYREYIDLVAALPPDKQARQAERKQVANDQYAALEPQVPTLTLVMPKDAPAGLVVELDGEALGPDGLSKALRLDPGMHQVVVRAPSGEARTYDEDLAAGARRVLTLEPPDSDSGQTARPGGDGSWGPMHTAAVVAGGVGVVGLVVGLITGGMAMGEAGTIDDNCVDTQCNQTGLDAADSGQTLAAVSTAGFVIGGIGLAAGTVLWLVAPDSEPAEQTDPGPSAKLGATVGPTGATVGLTVTW